MTALDTTPPPTDATAERRAAARDAYRVSLADRVPLTGAELGRRFGLSPRWGRLRVAEVDAEAAAASIGTLDAMSPTKSANAIPHAHNPTTAQGTRPSGAAPNRHRTARTAAVDSPSGIPHGNGDRPGMDRRQSDRSSTASRRWPSWRLRSSPPLRRTITSGSGRTGWRGLEGVASTGLG
jgi:hypothetical protein